MTMLKLMLADPLEDSVPIDGWVSAKLDGVRAGCSNGSVFSRNGKPPKNKRMLEMLSHPALQGLDGEVIVGAATGGDVLERSSAAWRTASAEVDFTYHVFDVLDMDANGFDDRYVSYLNRVAALKDQFPWVQAVPQVRVCNKNELLKAEERFLADGYEGLMYRKLHGGYHHGRSSPKMAHLLKLKRWEDLEAKVIGYEEQEANLNEAVLDELGRTKRSSHAENKVGKGTFGKFVCQCNDFPSVFRVGIGVPGKLDDKKRAELWEARETLAGQYIRVRYFAYGSRDAPRFPKFDCFVDASVLKPEAVVI